MHYGQALATTIAIAAMLAIPVMTLGFGHSPFALLGQVAALVDQPQPQPQPRRAGPVEVAGASVSRPTSGATAGGVVTRPTTAPTPLPTLEPVQRPAGNGSPAAAPPAAPAATWVNGVVVAAQGVRVSRAAGTSAGDDPLLARGTPVLISPTGVIRLDNREYRSIRAANGVVGWLPSDAVTPSPTAAGARTQPQGTTPRATPSPAPTPGAAGGERAQVTNTDGVGVVLRASPRLEDRTPRGLMDGARVVVLERAGTDWARVRAENGQEGWVPTSYLAAQP